MEEIKKYGVKFTHGLNIGVRTYDAEGLEANVGVDDQIVRNDFDNIMPWAAMRRCNTALVDGVRVPTFFEGEAGYSSTEADVFVYVPLFYYYRSADDSERVISMSPLEGFNAPVKFKNANGTLRDYVFLPAYTAGLVNGVPASRSGLEPFITSLNGWFDLMQGLKGTGLHIESTMDDEIKNILLDVEFATRDPQAIMMGATCADDVFPSGACDGVRASSGSPASNTSGCYPCKYRGIENPWGNQFRWRWDVLVKDRVPYVLTDPAKYARGKVTDDYKALSYKISKYDGWVDKLGFDPNFPQVQLAEEVVDGYGDSFYGCYFLQWSNGTYALLVGGGVGLGRYAGARSCNLDSSPSDSNWAVGAALSPA